MAKHRALLCGHFLSSSLSPPSCEWKKEICKSPECCVSSCSFYLDAIKRNDLIIWTDASFFPDSRKCAAAFGWESDEGIRISAFRVRGSAARGEVLAIFAALMFVEQKFPDRDITLFSDCESALSRFFPFLSLSLSSPPSPPFLPLSPLNKRCCDVVQRLLLRGRKLCLHWVKAHASVIQNELIDAAAKKEALNFRREKLFEEKPQSLGEFTIQGQLVESRYEIEYDEWRPDLDKTVMRVARSYHARRIFAGVQQWRGLKSNWAIDVKGVCIYCHDQHVLAFGIFLQKCKRCAGYRKQIGRLWSDVTWDNELLEGRISHKIIREMMDKRAGSRECAVKEAKARVRTWERMIGDLCKELKGKCEEK